MGSLVCIYVIQYAHMYESLQMFTWGHLCVFMLYMYAHMCIHTAFPDANALGWLFISTLLLSPEAVGRLARPKASFLSHSKGPATAL